MMSNIFDMARAPSLKFRNRVPALRKARGLTQEQLGEAIGATRVTVNYIENGEYLPSLEMAFRLARYFGKSIEEMFWVEK